MSDVEVEIAPGLIAGQKAIPVDAAGCYKTGRYSHIVSAIMTVTTAKRCSRANMVPRRHHRAPVGVAPAIVYAVYILAPIQSWPWRRSGRCRYDIRPAWPSRKYPR
jgi:sulfopropanediol 3-dehydrogenase